jgi:hypothetical protein
MRENELQQNNNNNDDEISLIDLLVVVLKYRRVVTAVVVLGIIAAAGYYAVNKNKEPASGAPSRGASSFEGRVTAAINPRLGRGGEEKFPPWFNSEELKKKSLKEAGLSERNGEFLEITESRNTNGAPQNNAMDIHLKPGPWTEEQVENLLTALIRNAETLAAAYYTQYARDIAAYFESSASPDKDYPAGFSPRDYALYRWAKDFLGGRDTVLKTLYPPQVSEAEQAGGGGVSPLIAGGGIVVASIFLGVFLAFLLNALRNIGADGGAMAKIRSALGK